MQNHCDQETSLLLLLFEQIRLLLVSVATCAEKAEAVAEPAGTSNAANGHARSGRMARGKL